MLKANKGYSLIYMNKSKSVKSFNDSFSFYFSGIRIVDEEIDLKKIAAGFEKDEYALETQEDEPFVAEYSRAKN